MNTHKFTLPSGVEAEVSEFTGKEQRILTESNGKTFTEKLTEALGSVLIRLGSLSNPPEEIINKMFAADKQQVLKEARMFSLNWEPMFRFKYDYEDVGGKAKTHTFELILTEKEKDEAGVETGNMVPKDGFGIVTPFKRQYKEYDAVSGANEEDVITDKTKEVVTVLPSGKKVKYRMLDTFGEDVGSKTKKKARSTHTPLIMRNPREVTKLPGVDKEQDIVLNLDKLSMRDIEALRTDIFENEGRVATEIKLIHPDAENRIESEKVLTVDVVQQLAFFYPSEAI